MMSFENFPFARYNNGETQALSKAHRLFLDMLPYFPYHKKEYLDCLEAFPGWKKEKKSMHRKFIIREVVTENMLTTAIQEAENAFIAGSYYQYIPPQDAQDAAITLTLQTLGVLNRNMTLPQRSTQNEVSTVLKFILNHYTLHPCFPYTKEELCEALQYRKRH